MMLEPLYNRTFWDVLDFQDSFLFFLTVLTTIVCIRYIYIYISIFTFDIDLFLVVACHWF